MILSFRHRFVFVRARKVAGTSVEMALSTVCGGDDIVPPMIAVDERQRQVMGGFSGNYCSHPLAEKHYAKAVLQIPEEQLGKLQPPPTPYTPHMAVADIASVSGQALDGLRLIAVARNPYSRLISFLHMRRHFGGYRAGSGMPGQASGLSEELDRMRAAGGIPALKSLTLYDSMTPDLLRYETLESDLAVLGSRLGVAFPPLPHAKRGVLSDTIDPHQIFSRSQLDWINSYLAEEFSVFGYATV